MIRKFIVLAALPLCFALNAGSASAADAHTEIVTAATHAGLGAGSTALDMVHMHLHHTVNCLVGPMGKGFDKTALNPCVNSGNGAIPDSTSAAAKKSLWDAVDKAEAGIAATDLAVAQKDATDTAAMLKAVP
jgi:hypothetical protein